MLKTGLPLKFSFGKIINYCCKTQIKFLDLMKDFGTNHCRSRNVDIFLFIKHN